MLQLLGKSWMIIVSVFPDGIQVCDMSNGIHRWFTFVLNLFKVITRLMELSWADIGDRW